MPSKFSEVRRATSGWRSTLQDHKRKVAGVCLVSFRRRLCPTRLPSPTRFMSGSEGRCWAAAAQYAPSTLADDWQTTRQCNLIGRTPSDGCRGMSERGSHEIDRIALFKVTSSVTLLLQPLLLFLGISPRRHTGAAITLCGYCMWNSPEGSLLSLLSTR